MKKFEYRVLLADCKPNGLPAHIENIVSQEGRNGWELVGSTRDQYPTDTQKNDQIMLILKRLMP
jgi:hypothetical protein